MYNKNGATTSGLDGKRKKKQSSYVDDNNDDYDDEDDDGFSLGSYCSARDGNRGYVDDNGTTTTPAVLRSSRRRMTRKGLLYGICFILIAMVLAVGATMYFLFRNQKNNESQESQNSSQSSNNKNDTTVPTNYSGDSSTSGSNGQQQQQQQQDNRLCNGHENLCDVPFPVVFFGSVHNAASTTEDGVGLLPNHAKSLEKALVAGYRGINLDLGKCASNGALRFLHRTCLIGSRDPIEVFTNILNFLTENPQEVLLLTIQIDNGGGNVTLQEIYTNIIQKVNGLEDMLYTQLYESSSSNTTFGSWPTLRQLIAIQRRIVMFHYDATERCSTAILSTTGNSSSTFSNNQPNTNDSTYDTTIPKKSDTNMMATCPPGMQEWFRFAAETPFEFETVESFQDNLTFSCELTRGQTQPRNQSAFLGMNLFTMVPSVENCRVLNSESFIQEHVNSCLSQPNTYSRRPNVLFIDYWDIGSVLQVIYAWNQQINPNDYVLNNNNNSINISELEQVSAPIRVTFRSTNSTSGSLSRLLSDDEIIYLESVCQTYFSDALSNDTLRSTTSAKFRTIVDVTCILLSQTLEQKQQQDKTNAANRRIQQLQQQRQIDHVVVSNQTRSLVESSLALNVVIEVSALVSTTTSSSTESNQQNGNEWSNSTLTSIDLKEIIDETGDDFLSLLVESSTSNTTSTTNSTNVKDSITVFNNVTSIESNIVDLTTISPTISPSIATTYTSSTLPTTDTPLQTPSNTLFSSNPTVTATSTTATTSSPSAIMFESSQPTTIPTITTTTTTTTISNANVSSTKTSVTTPTTIFETLMPSSLLTMSPSSLITITTNTGITSTDTPSVTSTSSPTNYSRTEGTHSPSSWATIPVTSGLSNNQSENYVAVIGTDNESSTTRRCNGHENLCDVPVNRVMFATLHNAQASLDDGFLLFPNHQQSLEAALVAGYRGINVDIGICNGKVQLVHGFCALGTRDPTTVFTNILSFLQSNPNEIILLITQIDNDTGGDVTNTAIDAIFQSIPSFHDMMYQHSVGQQVAWPTLQQLIQANQRLLYFQYNSNYKCMDETTGKLTGNCPTGFHDWFLYAGETRYDFQSVDEFDILNNSSSNSRMKKDACQITRGPVDGSSMSAFYGLNVFTTIPNNDNSCSVLNSAAFLNQFIMFCSNYYDNLLPSVILIDCWDVGDVLEIVQQYNNNITMLLS